MVKSIVFGLFYVLASQSQAWEAYGERIEIPDHKVFPSYTETFRTEQYELHLRGLSLVKRDKAYQIERGSCSYQDSPCPDRRVVLERVDAVEAFFYLELLNPSNSGIPFVNVHPEPVHVSLYFPANKLSEEKIKEIGNLKTFLGSFKPKTLAKFFDENFIVNSSVLPTQVEGTDPDKSKFCEVNHEGPQSSSSEPCTPVIVTRLTDVFEYNFSLEFKGSK